MKTARPKPEHLSRRERQIMDIVYATGRATVGEVRAALPDPPGYSAVRSLLRILEEKGHLRHEQDGLRYVYRATRPRQQAARSMLNNMLNTFFAGSVEQAVATMLTSADTKPSADELERIAALIEQAKLEER